MDVSSAASIPSLPDTETQHIEEPVESSMTKHHSDQQSDNVPSIVQSKEFINYTLRFLSTASNETLLCCVVCLMGATYILLGRLGLILIGMVSGVVLHASWEEMNTGNIGDLSAIRNSSRRKELALNISNRLLDWPSRKAVEADLNHDELQLQAVEETSKVELDYSNFRPETATALRSLTDAVLRNYVNYWYEPILPSESTFPLSCRRILTSFIVSMSSHLKRKRTADTFLEFLTNSSSMIIVLLSELSTAFEKVGSSMTPEETIKRYLELSPDSSLANLLADQQQRKKLNMIADDILSSFLDSKAYGCSALRDFSREILAGVAFESTITSLSRPEFINGWIIYIFSEGEPEIMNAIDAGVEGARNQGVTTSKNTSDVDNPLLALVDENDSGSKLSSKPDKRDSTQADKATEEAIMETKRLSSMIAAQDLQSVNLEHTLDKDRDSVFTLDGDGAITRSHTDIKRSGDTVNKDMLSDPTDAKQVQHIHDPISGSSREPFPPAQSQPSVPEATPSPPVFSLHCASVSVDDGSEPGEKGLFRSKPTSNYLLQIEPASTRSTGWMVFRKYADFETLHGTLETISRLNMIRSFMDDHPVLPPWKGQMRQELARNLERYLHDALKHEPLAESERMKRFLEKDGGLGSESTAVSTKSGFSFPSQAAFENVGKGVLGVLTNAPKGVAGVFGGGNSRKPPNGKHSHLRSLSSLSQSNESFHRLSEDTDDTKSRGISRELKKGRKDSLFDETQSLSSLSSLPSTVSLDGTEPCKDGSPDTLSKPANSNIKLGADGPETGVSTVSHSDPQPHRSLASSHGSHEEAKEDSNSTTKNEQTVTAGQSSAANKNNPITQDETQIAVELIFAVINELYSLSSAWNIRRTILNTAKSYILRPGSPTLETIRALLQDSMIDANTSDEALGLYITKLRENALPTPEELSSWPPPPSDAEKARLRETARKAFVQRGLPEALTGVMGAAASREALEKVFDSLQVESIARGFIFSILLQALRAVAF